MRTIEHESIDIVLEERLAVKAHVNNSAGLINWVDFADVREHFSYFSLSELQTKSLGAQGAFNLPYTKYPATTITTISNIIFFISYFSNLILQAVLTQPAKDSPSFLACCWINSSRSSSKRIVCLVLFKRSLLLFVFFSCIGAVHYGRLYLTGAVHYKDEHYKKQSPEVLVALSRDLTQPLNGVMIMAKSYDSAHLCARQSKLYKFYDLSTAQVVQTTATTERQARKNLGKQSLIFIARKPINPIFKRSINWGGYSHA